MDLNALGAHFGLFLVYRSWTMQQSRLIWLHDHTEWYKTFAYNMNIHDNWHLISMKQQWYLWSNKYTKPYSWKCLKYMTLVPVIGRWFIIPDYLPLYLCADGFTCFTIWYNSFTLVLWGQFVQFAFAIDCNLWQFAIWFVWIFVAPLVCDSWLDLILTHGNIWD